MIRYITKRSEIIHKPNVHSVVERKDEENGFDE